MSDEENLSVDLNDSALDYNEVNLPFYKKRFNVIVAAAVACVLLLLIVVLVLSKSTTADSDSTPDSSKQPALEPKLEKEEAKVIDSSTPSNSTTELNESIKPSSKISKKKYVTKVDKNGGYFKTKLTSSLDAAVVIFINFAIENDLAAKVGPANSKFETFWEEKASKGDFKCPEIHQQTSIPGLYNAETQILAFLSELGFKIPAVKNGNLESCTEDCSGAIDYFPSVRELGDGRLISDNDIQYEAAAFITLIHVGKEGGLFHFYFRQPGSSDWEMIDDVNKLTKSKIPHSQVEDLFPTVALYRKVKKGIDPAQTG